METKITEYYEDWNEAGISYYPLKPTGRWKIATSEYRTNELFIEHKGWFFKRWIPEGCIHLLPERSSVTNNCKP